MTSVDLPFDPGGLDPFPADVGVASPSDFAPMEFRAIGTPAPDFASTALDAVPGLMGNEFSQDAAGNIWNPDGSLAVDAAGAEAAGFLPEPSPIAPPVPTADILRADPSDPRFLPPMGPTTPDFEAPVPTPGTTPTARPGVDWTKLLATLGIGGLGLGISQSIAAGGPSRIRVSQPPQTEGQKLLSDLFANNPAAGRALQETILRALQTGTTGVDVLGEQLNAALAAQRVEEPTKSLIRNAALENLLSMSRGEAPADPVTAALRKQLLSVTLEGTTDPRLERLSREERDVLQNREFMAQGQNWRQTTPGIDAAQKLEESQAIRSYENYLATIGALAGPYRTGVGQAFDTSVVGSRIGLPDVPATLSALTGIANPSGIGGVTTTNEQARSAQDAQNRAAIASAFAEQQRREGLGQGISSILGRAGQNAFSLAA